MGWRKADEKKTPVRFDEVCKREKMWTFWSSLFYDPDRFRRVDGCFLFFFKQRRVRWRHGNRIGWDVERDKAHVQLRLCSKTSTRTLMIKMSWQDHSSVWHDSVAFHPAHFTNNKRQSDVDVTLGGRRVLCRDRLQGGMGCCDLFFCIADRPRNRCSGHDGSCTKHGQCLEGTHLLLEGEEKKSGEEFVPRTAQD